MWNKPLENLIAVQPSYSANETEKIESSEISISFDQKKVHRSLKVLAEVDLEKVATKPSI